MLEVKRAADLNLKWVPNNKKWNSEGIIGIGLPPGKPSFTDIYPCGGTCLFAGWCSDRSDTGRINCYAQNGYYRYPRVINARIESYNILQRLIKSGELAPALIADLCYYRKLGRDIMRPNDSGDVYCREYAGALVEAATELSDMTIYLYTKAWIFFKGFDIPNNMVIIQSFGGLNDSKIDMDKPNAKVFNTIQEMEKEGYVDCTHSDRLAVHTARQGNGKIGLIYH